MEKGKYGEYDAPTQMFKSEAHLDTNKLEFHRHLADTGAYADDMYAETIDFQKAKDEKALADVRSKLAEHVARQGDY